MQKEKSKCYKSTSTISKNKNKINVESNVEKSNDKNLDNESDDEYSYSLSDLKKILK